MLGPHHGKPRWGGGRQAKPLEGRACSHHEGSREGQTWGVIHTDCERLAGACRYPKGEIGDQDLWEGFWKALPPRARVVWTPAGEGINRAHHAAQEGAKERKVNEGAAQVRREAVGRLVAMHRGLAPIWEEHVSQTREALAKERWLRPKAQRLPGLGEASVIERDA